MSDLRRLAEAALRDHPEFLRGEYRQDYLNAVSDPQTVLALLDRIAALEGALRALVGMVEENGPDYADADQMEQARAVLTPSSAEVGGIAKMLRDTGA